MTRTEMQARVSALREELEHRHKHGTIKSASTDGVSIEKLQEELYSLIYKLSKREP